MNNDIVCGGESVLQVIKFVMMLLDVICFLVPIGLILMMMVDLTKNVVAGKEDTMKKNANFSFKRLILAGALFLVPTIVKFSVSLLGNLGVNYAECIEIALTEDLSKYRIEYKLDNTNPTEVDLSNPSGGLSVVEEDESKESDNGTASNDDSQTTSGGSSPDYSAKSISVAEAKIKYASELKSAYKKYVSDTIFVSISKEVINGTNFFVTHIVVEKGNQIFGEPAKGSYASGLETTSSAFSRVKNKGRKVIVAINGSHFNYSDGSQDLAGANNVVIVNRNIKTSGNSGGMEILLKDDGSLYTASGVSASSLISAGVKYSFSSHDTHFIENGALANDVDGEDTSHNGKYPYYSTVIGMVAPRNYYILTGTSTNRVAAQYLLDKGCVWAKSMDQGGSVSLVFKGELLNASYLGKERAVGDFLMFSE